MIMFKNAYVYMGYTHLQFVSRSMFTSCNNCNKGISWINVLFSLSKRWGNTLKLILQTSQLRKSWKICRIEKNVVGIFRLDLKIIEFHTQPSKINLIMMTCISYNILNVRCCFILKKEDAETFLTLYIAYYIYETMNF